MSDQPGAKDLGARTLQALQQARERLAVLEPRRRAPVEHAGQAGDVYGSSTGVFAGVCSFDYAGLKFASNRQSAIDPYFATGNAICAVSGRTSYALGLKGPSLSIDTACSSSIVSVH